MKRFIIPIALAGLTACQSSGYVFNRFGNRIEVVKDGQFITSFHQDSVKVEENKIITNQNDTLTGSFIRRPAQ